MSWRDLLKPDEAERIAWFDGAIKFMRRERFLIWDRARRRKKPPERGESQSPQYLHSRIREQIEDANREILNGGSDD